MSAVGRGRELWARLLGRTTGDDAREELEFHLEMRVRDYLARGLTEDEARRAAAARLGDLERAQKECQALAHAHRRSRRRRNRLKELRQDLRYGVRGLLRAPSFSIMAIVTLMVGIGATTAIYSVVHTVLLAPLPYSDADRLVRIWEVSPDGDHKNVVSAGNVVDWRSRSTSFEKLGAHRLAVGVTLTGEGPAARIAANAMHPAIMDALGAEAHIGRTLLEQDAVAEEWVVVLSHAFWTERYGADPDVVGRGITLNDVSGTIVGVMRPDFAFPTARIDVWYPLTEDELDPESRISHNYLVLGRLAPGTSVERAQAEMSSIARRLAEEHPAAMEGWDVNVVPLHEDLTGDYRTLLFVLLGAVGVVLLIASANLANLLLARAVAREREMAVRGALGASRGRLLRQLATESLLLGGVGGGAGILLAFPLLRALVNVAPIDIPFVEGAVIDFPMLGFALLTILVSALLFSLAPALHLARVGGGASIGGRRVVSGRGHARIRGALLVAQVSFSVVLGVGAGLFVRSFHALNAIDVGFDPEGLLTMSVDVPSARYEGIVGQEAFVSELIQRVESLPSVERAAVTTQEPGAVSVTTFSFAIENRPSSSPNGREDDEPLRAISPGYFETMGQEVVRGRAFTALDRADAPPVVILNEALARKHWGDGNPVGERIAFRVGETPWREIVGVVRDTRLSSPDLDPTPGIYIPRVQRVWPWMTWADMVVRSTPGTESARVHEDLMSTLLELDPQLPPLSLGSVDQSFRRRVAGRSFAMTLVSGFGVLALLLSVVGLYGLINYDVARERREIGVRIAIGAGPARVLRRILGRALVLTGIGAVIGVGGALAASSAVESLLYGISPVDLATYLATVALMGFLAFATAAAPAWRAAKTDPSRVLQAE